MHGLRAGLAALSRREVVRFAVSPAARAEVEGVVRGRPIVVRPDREIARIAGTDLHEGLVVEVKERAYLAMGALESLLHQQRGTAIALDRVRNPYNIGAIVRSAAFFGIDAVLLGAPAPHPGIPPEAVRVAEGGAEHIAFARTTDLAQSLVKLRGRGVRVVGTAMTDAASWKGPALDGRPLVLVLGNEREGLSDRVRAACDACIHVGGSGAVESLNVAVTAGVLFAELMSRAKLGGSG